MPFDWNETLNHYVRYHLKTKSRDYSAIAISNDSRLYFAGILLVTNLEDDVTLNIYDNNGPSGARLCPKNMVIEASNSPFTYEEEPPILCESGHIYVDIGGATINGWQVTYDI